MARGQQAPPKANNQYRGPLPTLHPVDNHIPDPNTVRRVRKKKNRQIPSHTQPLPYPLLLASISQSPQPHSPAPYSPQLGKTVSAVSADATSATATVTYPYIEPYVRATCPPPYTTYHVCYRLDGTWTKMESVDVRARSWCRMPLENGGERIFNEGEPEYAFCRMIEERTAEDTGDEATPTPTMTPTMNATNITGL